MKVLLKRAQIGLDYGLGYVHSKVGPVLARVVGLPFNRMQVVSCFRYMTCKMLRAMRLRLSLASCLVSMQRCHDGINTYLSQAFWCRPCHSLSGLTRSEYYIKYEKEVDARIPLQLPSGLTNIQSYSTILKSILYLLRQSSEWPSFSKQLIIKSGS